MNNTTDFCVRYQVTAEDLLVQWEFLHFDLAAGRRFTMLMDVTWALIFSAWIYLTWASRFTDAHPEWWIQLLVFANPGGAAFWLLRAVGPRLSRFLAQSRIKRGLYHDHIGETEVAVSPSQLRYQDSKHRVSIEWDTVPRVECHSTQILFCLQNGGGIFLPRRIFASEVQEQEFLTLVARYRSNTGSPEASKSALTVPASAVTPGASLPWYQSHHSLDTETRDVQRVGPGKNEGSGGQRTGMNDI